MREDHEALFAALAVASEEQKAEWRRRGWCNNEILTVGGYTWVYCENCQTWLPDPKREKWDGPHVC